MASLPRDMRAEIATLRTDPNRSLFGDRILPEDSTLASRGQGKGLWLYDELERDDQVFATMQKRRLALVGREWSVDAADDSAAAEEAAAFVQNTLRAMRFDRLVEDLLDALLKGVGIVELIWRGGPGGIVPVGAKARDPRRFVFRDRAEGVELRLLTREQMMDGIELPDRKFIVHRFGGRYDNPWGLGLGHRLFWPVFFKRQGVTFWLSGIDKFGTPTPVGKYAPGTSQAEIRNLLDALKAFSTESAIAIPEGMVAELLEAKRAGTFDGHEKLVRYMDESISRIVLGETLSTSAGDNGSRALGEIHNEVRLELTKADADLLSATLNATLIPWVMELNRPGAPLPKLWWDVSEPEDLNARATRDGAIKALGYQPTPDYILETYGKGWEAAPEPVAPPPAPPGRRGGRDVIQELFAEAAAARPRDIADDLAEQLDDVAADAQREIVDRLRGLVDRASSLQEIADGLVALYPELPTAWLAELMAQAMTVAALAGRSDILDGA